MTAGVSPAATGHRQRDAGGHIGSRLATASGTLAATSARWLAAASETLAATHGSAGGHIGS